MPKDAHPDDDRSTQGWSRSIGFIAPRHPDGADWPWITRIGPMARHATRAAYIENTWLRLPKATRLHVLWQYVKAARTMRDRELVFLFSTDIGVGLTRPPASWFGGREPRVYVGFTQDGAWSNRKVARLGKALRASTAVTVFSNEERSVYLQRYSLEPSRVHTIPIHTDETQSYDRYDAEPPVRGPYVLSLGSPNRRFTGLARVCRALGVPLVIITRPTHTLDSLKDLEAMGATIITNADRHRSLSAIRHARFMAMAFDTPQLPGAFTTLIHAMFLGTPSVVSRCLGMDDYVAEDVNGLVVPHGDEAAMQTAISRLWHDDVLLARYRAAGLERAQRLHSLEAAAVRFDQLIEDVLKRR